MLRRKILLPASRLAYKTDQVCGNWPASFGICSLLSNCFQLCVPHFDLPLVADTCVPRCVSRSFLCTGRHKILSMPSIISSTHGRPATHETTLGKPRRVPAYPHHFELTRVNFDIVFSAKYCETRTVCNRIPSLFPKTSLATNRIRHLSRPHWSPY